MLIEKYIDSKNQWEFVNLQKIKYQIKQYKQYKTTL